MTNLSRLGTHPPACMNWPKGACKNRNCPFLHQTFVIPNRPLGLPLAPAPHVSHVANAANSSPAEPAPAPASHELEACRHGDACKYLARGACRFKH